MRVVHNRENPFVQLNKHALWDQKLSLKAVGLWARCMSRPDDWHFNMSELEKNCKEGRTALYSAVDELIEQGYALRYQPIDDEGTNTFLPMEYVFFEFSITNEEKETYLNNLKKSLPRSGFPHAGFPHTGNQPLLIKNIKEKEEATEKEQPSLKVPEEPAADAAMPAKAGEEEIIKPQRAKPEFSHKVRELAMEMIDSLMRTNCEYRPPTNLRPMLTHVDFMLRTDARNPVKVMDVFNWALADEFWRDKMFKPNPAKYLREKYDQLSMKMIAKAPEAKKPRRFAASSDDAKALENMQIMRETAL